MDALWLANLAWPAYVATGLTVATGALLLFLDRKRPERLADDLALNAWMWMNALWVISDLGRIPSLRYAAMGVSAVGAILLLNAIRPSKRSRGRIRRLKKLRARAR
jgi:hypothetical protein